MKERPHGLEDADIRRALAEGWAIRTTAMRYVRRGGGSYHWDVEAHDGRRWFVSATDLDHAPWLGADRGSSWRTLEATMRTALTLRDDAGLSFVLAPVSSLEGRAGRRVRDRYGLVVHPFVDGACGDFGATLSPAELLAVIEIIAELHATPAAAVGLDQLVDLTTTQSPHAADSAFRRIVDRYDELAAHVADRPLVITHGEPHAGNVMRAGDDTFLIDWDTAALASPERDLWLLLDHGHTDVLQLYGARTGWTLDPAALAFYRLRWALEELVGAMRDCDDTAIRQALHKADCAGAI